MKRTIGFALCLAGVIMALLVVRGYSYLPSLTSAATGAQLTR